MFNLKIAEFDKNLNNIKVNSSLIEVSEISGTPCSFGEVEGEVLVIDDINNKRIVDYYNFDVKIYASKENIKKLLQISKVFCMGRA